MVKFTMRYEGGLHCVAKHEPSGTTLATDAPVDNQGKGETFSPTDLVATALGTCMLTTMGILAKRKQWNIDGIEMNVAKEMTKSPPRRIERIPVEMAIPTAVASKLDAQARAELEQAAHTCPVRISLLPAIEVPIVFRWR
ncbi:MAG TPA: OsmC family protein [Polyangiales bacterium]|jgi:putative redox protein|nr:OsmC family protein [Polyangiales bacterium]